MSHKKPLVLIQNQTPLLHFSQKAFSPLFGLILKVTIEPLLHKIAFDFIFDKSSLSDLIIYAIKNGNPEI